MLKFQIANKDNVLSFVDLISRCELFFFFVSFFFCFLYCYILSCQPIIMPFITIQNNKMFKLYLHQWNESNTVGISFISNILAFVQCSFNNCLRFWDEMYVPAFKKKHWLVAHSITLENVLQLPDHRSNKVSISPYDDKKKTFFRWIISLFETIFRAPRNERDMPQILQ